MFCNGDNPVLRITGIEHLHWKEGTFEVLPRAYCVLSFRLRGSAAIKSSGNTYNIRTNEILYLPQNMGYTVEYTDSEIIGIHFVTLRDDRQIELYTAQNAVHVASLFSQALTLWENKKPGFAGYCMAQLYTILGTLLESETKSSLPPRFLKAVSIINTNYRNPDISVDMVCGETGMGATVFRQLFKQHYQKTPTEYITGLRLEYARKLISSGDPIEKAAFDSGFNDPKYFARVVKRYFGCTPRDFKTYGK